MDNETKIWGAITVVALCALLVLLGQEYGGLFDSESSNTDEMIVLSSTADDPDPLSEECVTHEMNLGRHDHSVLSIFINGNERQIPENMGINTEVCNEQGGNMHTVHTHDATGKLHIETEANVDMPLGVFFDIWGVHFNETGIFDYRVSNTHELIMTVDGVTNYEFDDYLLVDGKEIADNFSSKYSRNIDSFKQAASVCVSVSLIFTTVMSILSVELYMRLTS